MDTPWVMETPWMMSHMGVQVVYNQMCNLSIYNILYKIGRYIHLILYIINAFTPVTLINSILAIPAHLFYLSVSLAA